LPAAAEEISGAPDGRTGIRRAVQHLYVQSKRMQPLIGMPGGSPFGAVAVDPARCTLCMACSVACPSGALLAGGDIPRLSFIESRCHQCGLCHEICPEGAMRLVPRILCDPDAVKAPSVLCEAEPFRCVVCGAPFTTQSMLNRMMDRLANHWMYAGDRQRRRLQMCRVCRTRDALISKDATAWNR
jgi:ferredoxin